MNALILVDIQNDFCPGGALGVPEGDAVVPLANALQSRFDLVVATQDWHPPHHASFAAEGGIWPVHCVQESWGADFVAGLDLNRVERVFRKGENPAVDSYSGFFDNDHHTATGLGDYLKSRGVQEVFVCGLATDYCVKATVLDALSEGFAAAVVADACRGVNVEPDDSEAALRKMQAAGARIVSSNEV